MSEQFVVQFVGQHQDFYDDLRQLLTRAYDLVLAQCADTKIAVQTAMQSGAAVVVQYLEISDTDGLDLVRALRHDLQTAEIPLVIITENADPEAINRAFEAGVSDYIINTPECVGLIERLRSHAGRYTAIQQQRECLEVFSKTEDALRASNAELLRSVATNTALGIASPQMLFDYMDYQRHRSVREKIELSLVLLKLGDFASWQARAGESHSRVCLKRVTSVLQECARCPEYLAGQIDNEKFAIVMPATTTKEAQTIAEYLRQEIASTLADFVDADNKIQVSVSIEVIEANLAPQLSLP